MRVQKEFLNFIADYSTLFSCVKKSLNINML
jgi:hypothetical protein